jgi:hypothetical protein
LDGDVEVHEYKSIDVAVTGPTELAPVIQAGEAILPAAGIIGLVNPLFLELSHEVFCIL